MNVISVRGPGTPPPSEIDAEDEGIQETEISPAELIDGNTVLTEDMSVVSTPSLQIPMEQRARSRFFLEDEKRKEVAFEKGFSWAFDFYGAWVDFNMFVIKLPGMSLNLLNYWDGQPVRYVLKNKVSGEIYAVIMLELEKIQEDEEGQKGTVDGDID